MYREQVVQLLLAGTLVMTAPACGVPGDDEPAERLAATGGWRTPGCELSRPPRHVIVGGREMLVTPPGLAAVMDRIDRGGREQFAESFAGIEVDQVRVRAVVYRVPSAAFDDFIRASADSTCIVVRDAAHSVAELTRWHDRVLAELPFWTAQGLRITSIGSRHDGSGVEIGTRDLDRTRHDFLARYGEHAPLVFAEEDPVRPLAPG